MDYDCVLNHLFEWVGKDLGMNKIAQYGLFGLLMTLSLGAYSAEWQHSKRGEIYGGLVAMQLELDKQPLKANAIGGTFGINLKHTPYGSIALDTSFSRTFDARLDRGNIEVDSNNASFYLALRTPQRVYGIAKAGLTLSNLSSKDEVLSDNKSGLSVAVGAGAELFAGIDVEASYTHAPDVLDTITLALIFGD